MYAFGRLLWRARAGSRRTVAGCRPPPVDADHDLEEILANNKRWVAATNAADPTFFPKLAEGQSPQFLYVGCSDSRLVPNDMLGLGLGNLFVHRNVANLVVASDLNFLSVLTYAVEHLDVKHVLVTGHYDCGGVRAAMKNRGLGASSESVSPSSAKNELELDELDAVAPMASTRCRAASTPSTRPSESLPASGTVSRLRRSTQVINSEQKINLNLTPGRWRLRETAVIRRRPTLPSESLRVSRESCGSCATLLDGSAGSRRRRRPATAIARPIRHRPRVPTQASWTGGSQIFGTSLGSTRPNSRPSTISSSATGVLWN